MDIGKTKILPSGELLNLKAQITELTQTLEYERDKLRQYKTNQKAIVSDYQRNIVDLRTSIEENNIKFQDELQKAKDEAIAVQSIVDGAVEKQISVENDIAVLGKKMQVKDAILLQLRGFFTGRKDFLERKKIDVTHVDISSILSLINGALDVKMRMGEKTQAS